MIIYRGPSKLDGAPILAVVTDQSGNRKTGDLAQLWILADTGLAPHEAVRTGADHAVCGDCPLRGTLTADGVVGRACYVVPFQAPRSVYAAAMRGSYETVTPAVAGRRLAGRAVRLGAYGDPAALPITVLRSLTKYASRTVGYTHQWRTCDRRYAAFCMASVESVDAAYDARTKGYRTFRVAPADDGALTTREIVCPASDEAGKRTTCARCGLCNGARSWWDRRKHIVIRAHGFGKKYVHA